MQAMAMCGAQVVVSDTEDMMQLLRINIEANMAALQTSSGKLIGSISKGQLCLMLPDMLMMVCRLICRMHYSLCPAMGHLFELSCAWSTEPAS